MPVVTEEKTEKRIVSQEQFSKIERDINYSNSRRSGYNLKAKLEELLGLTDFQKTLEQVNYIIGIIVSIVMLLYFIS